ncbi:MAG: efflux transporter outer membrane subunit [Pseudomonadota bacterium]
MPSSLLAPINGISHLSKNLHRKRANIFCEWLKISKFIGSIFPALLLTGCAALFKTPYQTPAATLPTAWQGQTTTASPAPNSWWQGFGDPVLNDLIAEALARNNDLAAATMLVYKAQLTAEQADSNRLPNLAVGANNTQTHTLDDGGKNSRSYAASGKINYEQDLWGKLGSRYDAARWQAEATAEDRASTALSLTGTTASLYWQIASLNQRIDLSKSSVAYAGQTLKLAQVRLAAGAGTAMETLEAERNLAGQEASQTTLIQQRVEARHALAILFDGPPDSLFIIEPTTLDTAILPDVVAGLPADLLARRPDLRAAESRLRSALATSDASRASLYPTITLNGSLGGSSENLSRLLSNPLATLASDLALPFVQWRDLQRNIKISETEYQQAIVSFRQALYTALTEVENCLSARQQYKIQEEKLELALQTARQTEELYRIRYEAGGALLTSWLDAQENRRQAEIAVAANRLNQLQNHITLCKALGGEPLQQVPADNQPH